MKGGKSNSKHQGHKKVKKAKELDVKALRAMDDVVEKVDKLMDKNVKFKTLGRSSDSDSSDSESGSASSDSSDSDLEKEKKKGKKSGKHRSGKSKTLTSYVKFPQVWPHSLLSLHFVSRNKKYEELTLAEFCAGYSTILETCKGSMRKYRTAHLTELMYLATKYQWRCVLSYHAACLLEIERGHLKWGDSFQLLQSTTLAGGFLNNSAGNASRGSNGSSSAKEEGILFCVGYQRGTCQQTHDHQGFFKGESRLLKHICAKCWRKSRKIAAHPENAENCPEKEDS